MPRLFCERKNFVLKNFAQLLNAAHLLLYEKYRTLQHWLSHNIYSSEKFANKMSYKIYPSTFVRMHLFVFNSSILFYFNDI